MTEKQELEWLDSYMSYIIKTDKFEKFIEYKKIFYSIVFRKSDFEWLKTFITQEKIIIEKDQKLEVYSRYQSLLYFLKFIIQKYIEQYQMKHNLLDKDKNFIMNCIINHKKNNDEFAKNNEKHYKEIFSTKDFTPLCFLNSKSVSPFSPLRDIWETEPEGGIFKEMKDVQKCKNIEEINVPNILYPEFVFDNFIYHRNNIITENDINKANYIFNIYEQFYYSIINNIEEILFKFYAF